MKQFIQPKTQWSQVRDITLNTLTVTIINDNCVDSATTYYELGFTNDDDEYSTTVPPITGNVTLSGDDYTDWDNSNEQLMQIVAEKLKLELV